MMPDPAILISYPLAVSTPVYVNSPPVEIRSHRAIKNGDSSNSSLVSFSNHAGTHLDLPKHFCDDGPGAAGLLSASCVFSPSFCVDLSDRKLTQISPEDLIPHIPRTGSAEALLVRTGMSEKRQLPEYQSDYPFIDPAVPEFLRKNYPFLKIFCTDMLSVANPLHREEGRSCHREFLCKSPSILILEDADLSDTRLGKNSWILKVFPVILDNLDAVPVVAILEPFGRPHKKG